MLCSHIGGVTAKEGWNILNISPGPDVDYVADIADLSRLDSKSVDEVYASHVLEHVDMFGVSGVLADLLRNVGFRNIERVEGFDLFEDSSTFAPYGKLISLNVTAVK